MSDFKLCYVEEPWAYFTTQALTDQWADDWNDCPYEHNAGEPYGPSPADIAQGKTWEIVRCAYDGPFWTPREGYLNSPYSVEVINKGVIAWLRSNGYEKDLPFITIFAGASPEEFIHKINSGGGSVYLAGDVWPYG